jgi:hypothetical protein
MLVILVNKVVDPKRIIEKNGWPSRKRGTRGCCHQKKQCVKTFIGGNVG